MNIDGDVFTNLRFADDHALKLINYVHNNYYYVTTPPDSAHLADVSWSPLYL